MTSARDALDSALIALRASGVENPRLDAELLLAAALDVPREHLITRDLVVEGAAVRCFQDFVRRRAVEREPVAYLLGHRPFRYLDLQVDPRVLIPRPETELLVELAVARLPLGARVIDVGTGSGAVALALRDERPDLDVSGSDIDRDALDVARSNGLTDAVEADGLPGGRDRWDAVVANLPYVEEGARLAPEITRHEPYRALFAGSDGLDAIRVLVAQADAAGISFVALEHGADQGAAVRALLGGDSRAETHQDLAGHDRVTLRC